VVANNDPLTASMANPCAAARAQALMLTGGFAHTTTSTDNFGESKTTAGSDFPSIGVVVPFAQVSLLAGLYVDKMGSISMVETDTMPAIEPEGAGTVYEASFKRETSVHSVPILVTRQFYDRLILAAGVVLAFCDIREETALDFSASGYVDTDDVTDTHAMGEGFIGAAQADLGWLTVGGLYRTGPDLDGSLEMRGKFAGLWRTEDVVISSRDAFKVGIRARPDDWVSVEVDYDRCPWSRLALDGRDLSNKTVERWAVGVQYTGSRFWQASRYPLALGYYRQPVDWQDAEQVVVTTGEVVEEAYTIGLSVPLARDKAAMSLAFEAGSRTAAASTDLDERFYRLSLSVSTMEVWRRSIKR
jgi:hypothetical protein